MFLHSKESRQTLQFAGKIRRRVSVVERMVWWTPKLPFVRLLAVVAGDTPHTSHPGNSYTFLSSLLWILSSPVILCGTSWHFCTLVGGTGEGGALCTHGRTTIVRPIYTIKYQIPNIKLTSVSENTPRCCRLNSKYACFTAGLNLELKYVWNYDTFTKVKGFIMSHLDLENTCVFNLHAGCVLLSILKVLCLLL